MSLTIGEAEAAQRMLQLVVPRLGDCQQLGIGATDHIVVGTGTVELGKILSEGRYLAERSFEVLGTGLNAGSWMDAIRAHAAGGFDV